MDVKRGCGRKGVELFLDFSGEISRTIAVQFDRDAKMWRRKTPRVES